MQTSTAKGVPQGAVKKRGHFGDLPQLLTSQLLTQANPRSPNYHSYDIGYMIFVCVCGYDDHVRKCEGGSGKDLL